MAPGTVGSLLGVALFLLAFPTGPGATALLILLSIPAAVWLSGRAEVAFGQVDPKPVVVDEIVGQWVALALLPRTAWYVVGAFLLFRLFDIWKPFSALEELPGGLGVVVDDLAAGVAANICLQIVRVIIGA